MLLEWLRNGFDERTAPTIPTMRAGTFAQDTWLYILTMAREPADANGHANGTPFGVRASSYASSCMFDQVWSYLLYCQGAFVCKLIQSGSVFASPEQTKTCQKGAMYLPL
eukprot:6140731-Amphidinium_carterae.1